MITSKAYKWSIDRPCYVYFRNVCKCQIYRADIQYACCKLYSSMSDQHRPLSTRLTRRVRDCFEKETLPICSEVLSYQNFHQSDEKGKIDIQNRWPIFHFDPAGPAFFLFPSFFFAVTSERGIWIMKFKWLDKCANWKFAEKLIPYRFLLLLFLRRIFFYFINFIGSSYRRHRNKNRISTFVELERCSIFCFLMAETSFPLCSIFSSNFTYFRTVISFYEIFHSWILQEKGLLFLNRIPCVMTKKYYYYCTISFNCTENNAKQLEWWSR